MDDVDRASHQEEMARAHALHFRRDVPKHTGYCLNCSEPLPAGHLFCKAEPDGDGCARDYDNLQAARKRNGT